MKLIRKEVAMSIQLQKLDYVIVYVSDMQRSTNFYRDVLGLSLKFSSPGWTKFNTGETTIALHRTGGPTPSSQPSLPPARPAPLGFIIHSLQLIYQTLKAHQFH